MKSPRIIAEIGCNHKGDMAIAKEMIMTAATYCKADVVKFQKRCNKELLSPEEYNATHTLKTHTARLTENTVSFWNSALINTASCKNGAMSSALNIPRRCGISLLPRRYARYIPTLSRYLRPAT